MEDSPKRAFSSRRTPSYPIFMVMLSIFGALWALGNFSRFHRAETCDSDFLVFYASGKLAFSSELYNYDSAQRIYRETGGCNELLLPVTRPAFFAGFMAPISALPYRIAYRLWYALGALAVLVFVCLWPADRWLALAVCAWFFPLMLNFVNGQDGPLMLLILGSAIRLLPSSETKSAAAFSLGGAKVHLFFPVALWILARFRKQYAKTLLLCGLGLFLISAAVAGLNWIPAWIRAAKSPVSNNPKGMLTFHAIGESLFAPQWAIWTVCALLLAASWLAFRAMSSEMSLALIPGVGMLVTGHAFLYDMTLCIPLILLILPGDYPVWLKLIAFASCIPTVHLLPAPSPLTLNAQWLTPSLVIGVLIVELTRTYRAQRRPAAL